PPLAEWHGTFRLRASAVAWKDAKALGGECEGSGEIVGACCHGQNGASDFRSSTRPFLYPATTRRQNSYHSASVSAARSVLPISSRNAPPSSPPRPAAMLSSRVNWS